MNLPVSPFLCFAICCAYAWPHSLPISSSGSRLNYGSERIASGQDAKRHQFPYHVSLQNEWGPFCGGSLISADLILTAAVCFYEDDDELPTVIFGAVDRNQNDTDVQVRKISHFIEHPDFGLDGFNYNLAVARLDEPVAFTDAVRPVKLVEGTECEIVDNVTLSGWGRTIAGTRPKKLQWVQLVSLSVADCVELVTDILGDRHNEIRESTICTVGSKDEYQGMRNLDSGGPLIRDSTGELIGVSTWGIGYYPQAHWPSAFTNICYYRQWIKDTTGI